MKTRRFSFLLILLVASSFLLASCSGAIINSWPGASTNQEVVYVSFQGAVYAVNAENGTLVWQFPKERPDPSQPFYAAPAVSEDGLVVVGNYGHDLYAIRPDGTQAWAFEAPGANFVATPLVTGDLVLAPATDNVLYAIDAANGAKRWTFKTGNVLWAMPASDGEVAFLPAMDHTLYALNLSDGSVVWQQDLGSALVSAPVLDEGGTLYLTNMDGEVIAVNPADGSIQWRRATEGRIWASPSMGDGVLYVGNIEGKVTALSAEDGAVVWQANAASPVVGGGAILPETVVFPTEGGSLVALNLEDGSQAWTQPVGGQLYSTPVVAGDKLVVPVTQGENILQAFQLNGQVSWPFALPK